MEKKIALFIFLFACVFSTLIYAQDEDTDDEEKEEKQVDTYYYAMNQAGDQYINIAINVAFPIKPKNLEIGGAGALGYHRFLTSVFAIGFDVSFGYAPTKGSNVFTYIPFLFNMTYQPTWKRFEFPITAGIGFAIENYLSKTYFPGFVAKGQVGACFRLSTNWSFGLEGNIMWMPQFYAYKDKRKYNYSKGSFCGAGLVARYHF